ncbi:FtsK/SpoIIIE domain-containing protein [Amycolatopsis sp. RTGN1]|uniref:FtsK/SpoIIIE domain-containing protein n=1 Tax=Amycolatopsis ponsaeliensis TaxID=2992142 RepID=UPI00254E12CC|nr:FtsK/SpoIIIE domain-containing protein [Amycolatopsis sp. RTGN1]
MENDGESRPSEPGSVPYRVLSIRMIWYASAVIVVLGVAVAVWLLTAFGHGDAQERNQLEAIKTAGTVVVGTGGAAALLLAARRQRSTEIGLKQKDLDQAAAARTHALQEQMAEDTRLDSAERRLTELYSTAVDQLGSDRLAVQLGGLYALERLGQNSPGQRQTIVNVLCAYLRMFTDAAADVVDGRENHIGQQGRVRQAVGEVLAAHLRPEAPDHRFWPDTDVDLAGASLLGFDLSGCRVRSAGFRSATFVGKASFGGTTFTDAAGFASAKFTAEADFTGTRFECCADFTAASFRGDALFTSALFDEGLKFDGAVFLRSSHFGLARFRLSEAAPVPFEELPPNLARQLTALPTNVPYSEVATSERDSLPLGVGIDGTPACWRYDADPHFVAFMGPESGKTTLLRTIISGIVERRTPAEALIMLVDYRRTSLGYVPADHLLAYAVTRPQLESMLGDVRESMRRRLPGPDVTQEQLKNRSWWSGPDLYVIVDDAELVSEGSDDPLEPLREFLPQAKDVGLHVVIARRTERAGEALGKGVLKTLADIAAPGVVGDGDFLEGPLLGGVWPSALMPGRVTSVRRAGQELVQLVWPGPEPLEAPPSTESGDSETVSG